MMCTAAARDHHSKLLQPPLVAMKLQDTTRSPCLTYKLVCCVAPDILMCSVQDNFYFKASEPGIALWIALDVPSLRRGTRMKRTLR